jgi:hypothetical protein
MRYFAKKTGILFFVFSLTIFCQQIKPLSGQTLSFTTKQTIQIGTFARPDEYPDLHKKVFAILRTEAEKRGYELANNGQIQINFSIATDQAKPGEIIAVSLTKSLRIPDPIVDFCAKNEVFYMAFKSKKNKELPAEGARIREYMSKEFMLNFHQMEAIKTFLTTSENIESDCVKNVNELLK